jgi:hypothetical protein
MKFTGRIGLVAATLLAAASSMPERAFSQVPDAFDVHNSGFAPASPTIDTKSVLMTASTGWVAARGMPGRFVGCPRPSSYMFSSHPGMFHYGWYMSPYDARFSRSWYFPYTRSWFYPSFPWYGGPGYGLGLGSMCGPGSPGSSFYWGGGYGYGGYGGYWGYGGYGGYGGSYWGYSGYGGGYWGSNRALGLDNGWGHNRESLRQTKGFRVIESRPTTDGADLRRTDPGRFEEWSRRFGNEAADARSAMPDARKAIGDALARTRASQAASRESISDAIARARTADRPGSAKPRPTPGRTKAATPARSASPSRTAAPSGTRARATPRSSARPSPSSAARSAPRSAPRPTGKGTRKSSPRSSGKTPQ